MAQARKNYGLTGALQAALLTATLLAGAHFARPVLLPLAAGVLFAMVLTPVCRFIERQGLRRAHAAALTVAAALGLFTVAGSAIVYQFAVLADNVQRYQALLHARLSAFGGGGDHLLARAASALAGLVDAVNRTLRGADDPATLVQVVGDPLQRTLALVQPWVAAAGVAAVVVVLVAFLLVRRDDMSDRLIQLIGHSRTGVTARALDECGQRISRYLSALSAVNLGYGVFIGVGLWAIGIPLAVLWGAIAGLLRFIPYAGAAAGFVGPLLLSLVLFPGWFEPMLIVTLFGAVEATLIGLAEPLVYGRTTGVSPVGLMVSALFWSWLWGPVGLLMATPLTVALAVAGKYVPGLGGVSMLLSEKVDISDHLRLYHRLLAGDRVGARAMVESAAAREPLAAIDALLLPVALKTALEARSGALSAEQRTALWRQLDDLLDEIEWKLGTEMSILTAGRPDLQRHRTRMDVVGLAVHAVDDATVLRMVHLLLHPWGARLVFLDAASPALLAEALQCLDPAAVVVCGATAAPAERLALARDARAAVPRATVLTFPDDGGTAVELRDLILARVLHADDAAQLLRSAWLRADGPQAEAVLDVVLRLRPLDRVCTEVIDPALRQLHDDAGSVDIARDAGERARAQLLTRFRDIVSAVRAPGAGAPVALMTAPDAAGPDLPLVLLSAVLRARGWDVLYLGESVGLDALPAVVDRARPAVAVATVPATGPDGARRLLRALERAGAPHVFLLGGDGATHPDHTLDGTLAERADRLQRAVRPNAENPKRP